MDPPWLHESNSRAQDPRCLPTVVEIVQATGGVVSLHSREKMDEDLDTKRDLLLRTYLKRLVAVFRSEAATWRRARSPGRINT